MIEFGKPVESPTTPPVEAKASSPIEQPNRDRFFIVVIGILLFACVYMLFDKSQQHERGNDGDKKEIVDDLDNKEAADSCVLIADRFPPSPDILEVAQVIRGYAEEQGVEYRWYDDNQADSKEYVDYAASRQIFPPCVVWVKKGKPVSVRDAKELAKGSVK